MKVCTVVSLTLFLFKFDYGMVVIFIIFWKIFVIFALVFCLSVLSVSLKRIDDGEVDFCDEFSADDAEDRKTGAIRRNLKRAD